MDIPRYDFPSFGAEHWRVPDADDVHREFMSSRDAAVSETTETPYAASEHGFHDPPAIAEPVSANAVGTAASMKKFFDPDIAKAQFFALAGSGRNNR